jgi:hypothetical protein
MSKPPPRRRRRRPEQAAKADSPKPRKRQRKQSVNSKLLLQIALFACAGIVLVGGIYTMDWQEIGKEVGLADDYESLSIQYVAHKEEFADYLEMIVDVDSAEALADDLKASTIEGGKIEYAINEFESSKEYSAREARRVENELKARNQAVDARLQREMGRIGSNPALSAALRKIHQQSKAALKEELEASGKRFP